MGSPEKSIFRVDNRSSRPLVRVGAVLVLGTMAAVFGCGSDEQALTTTNLPVPTPSPTSEIPPELKCPEGLPTPKIDSTGQFAADRITFEPKSSVVTVTIKDLIKMKGGCVEQLIGAHWDTRVPSENRDLLINDLNESGEAKASKVGTGKND